LRGARHPSHLVGRRVQRECASVLEEVRGHGGERPISGRCADSPLIRTTPHRKTFGFYDGFLGYPKVIVAEVRGYALGGGLEMALMSDISVVARDTAVGMPATRFLGPALGSLHMFFYRLGPTLARAGCCSPATRSRGHARAPEFSPSSRPQRGFPRSERESKVGGRARRSTACCGTIRHIPPADRLEIEPHLAVERRAAAVRGARWWRRRWHSSA